MGIADVGSKFEVTLEQASRDTQEEVGKLGPGNSGGKTLVSSHRDTLSSPGIILLVGQLLADQMKRASKASSSKCRG